RRAPRLLATNHGRTATTDERRPGGEGELKARSAAGGKARAAERTETITRLLSATGSAVMLAEAVADGRVPESVRPQVLAAAAARPEPQVRDLFERFLPDDQRVKRLGSVVKPQQILALKGDAARGRELFFK